MITRFPTQFSAILVLLLFLTACNKQSFHEPTDETLPAAPTLTAPQVTITDGMMTFKDFEEMNKVYDFARLAPTEQLLQWQESIGFRSGNYYFRKALQEYCCELDENAMNEVRSKYAGKVHASEDGVAPLFDVGSIGWLTNGEGLLKVGLSIIHYSDNYNISILDGSREKLQQALQNPVTDEAAGIIVIPAYAPQSELQFRSCLSGTEISGFAPLDAPWLQIGTHSFRIKEASVEVKNLNACVSSFDPQGRPFTLCHVKVVLRYHFHHQRKATFLGTVCERTPWLFNSDWRLFHNAPLSFGFPNPITGSKVNILTGNECKYDEDWPVLTQLETSISQAQNTNVTCIDRLTLSTTATNTGLNVTVIHD